MSQLNAIQATNSIKQRLLDFCRADHFVNDEQVDNICQNIWSKSPKQGGLCGDLWVEAAFPPKSSGISMIEQVEAGLISQELADLLDKNRAFDKSWELRQIQTESVTVARKADDSEVKPAIVISAGTGAGKTESFLFPLLDQLIREKRAPNQGASAIILYPMNALVTDQVDRLDAWLKDQSDLKIFHFTGETPEDHKIADREGYPKTNKCRFRTRQEARGLEDDNGRKIDISERADQPDIIVTNYSMLEYMLCRPQDSVFFGSNLRHIVLDEAHLYSGNLAAEITMLLRRTCSKARVSPDQIFHYATSATLSEGDIEEQKRVLREFGSNIFSKSLDRVKVVLGEKAPAVLDKADTNTQIPELSAKALAPWPELSGVEEIDGVDTIVPSTKEQWNEWIAAIQQLVPEFPDKYRDNQAIAPSLYQNLPSSSLFRKLYHFLYSSKLNSLEDITSKLWGSLSPTTQEATRRLLQLGAIARPDANSSPLLPNRIHWTIKAPDGLFFSFAHEYAPSEELIYRIDGTAVGYFYAPGYYTRPEADESHPLLALRDRSNGNWYLAGIESGCDTKCPPLAMQKTKDKTDKLHEKLSFYSLRDNGQAPLMFDHTSGQFDTLGVPLYPLNDKSEETTPNFELGNIQAFGSDSRLQLAVIAEAALMSMPAYPSDQKHWLPAEGRRMLIFSDSRAEAARLGPLLTNNHERQLFRAMVVESLNKIETESVSDIEKEIAALEVSLPSLPEIVKQSVHEHIERLEAKREELTEGKKPRDFVRLLQDTLRVPEFIHRETANKHKASSWSQRTFQANSNETFKNLDLRIAKELARRTNWPDLNLESTGLLEIVYPGIEKIQPSNQFLGAVSTEQARDTISQNYPQLVAAIMDHFRDIGAVSLGSDAENSEYSIGGGHIGKWISLKDSYRYTVVSMLSTFGNSQLARLVKNFLRLSGENEEQIEHCATELLTDVFKQLYERSNQLNALPWLEWDQLQVENSTSAEAMRIKFHELRIRRPIDLYRCSVTGQVWPRSVLGLHLKTNTPTLVAISHEDLTHTPRAGRMRKEWDTSAYFRWGLWAEEHSAQIGAGENRRLQDLFKSGIRNILSSTTTLELGIDIGGLNGVLMANIPPGKANYLQRAGRSGRRADGSSLVISYARNSPYERKVFENFDKYLNDKLREPSIFLDRKDILIRHFNAVLFGYFFTLLYQEGDHTGAMKAFGSMGAFTNVPQTAYWPKGLKPRAEANQGISNISNLPWAKKGSSLANCFNTYLESITKSPPENFQNEAEDLLRSTVLATDLGHGLANMLRDTHKKIQTTLEAWTNNYNELLKQWELISTTSDEAERNRANAIYFQLKQLYNMTLIECFSDAMVLPRYGFPIGLSELKVNKGKPNKSDENVSVPDEYRLNRSASQAIREYAPGSKLLVGGKIVSSRGILKSWTGQDIPSEGMGLRAWFKWDPTSQKFDYAYTPTEDNEKELLFVKHGFASAASDAPAFNGNPESVGNVKTIHLRPKDTDNELNYISNFGNIPQLKACLEVGGELLAMNSGAYEQGFAVCTKCGYADSEHVSSGAGQMDLPKGFQWHKPLHESYLKASSCLSSDSPHLMRHIHLAAKQISDFLTIELINLPGNNNDRTKIANTISQALRLSGASMLRLDPREISVLPPALGQKVKITLYDSLAGGSGHLRDLSIVHERWVQHAQDLINTGSIQSALLGLLTADSPTDENGMPAFDIIATRDYLLNLHKGATTKTALSDHHLSPDLSKMVFKNKNI